MNNRKAFFGGLLLLGLLCQPVTADFTLNNALCAAGATSAKDCGAPPVLKTNANTSAPSTPASGSTAVWTDSTDKNLKAKSDAGSTTITVKPTASTTHNFVTGIDSDGTVAKSQPAAGDISGLATSATTDTTNASNISTGTLGSSRGGAGAVSGILKANGSGTVSAAASGTDYAPATSGSAILKGNGTGGFSSAASGTDYAPATSGSSVLKGNGSGGFSAASSGTDYAPATSGSAILKGNGSGGFSSATSGTDYAPATSGSAILQGNGAGGFSSVTIGSGLTLSTGTLSATGAVSSVFGRTGAVTAATNDYSFSQLSGSISHTQMNSGTGASSSTFWRGDDTWATPSGAGNVSGPGSSTTGNLPSFTNTSGTVLQDSGIAASSLVTASSTNTFTNKSIDAAQLTGTVAAARFPALTGDVTSSAGAVATTIASNAVTNAKAAQMATLTIKGNNTASTANATDLTVAQAAAMLPIPNYLTGLTLSTAGSSSTFGIAVGYATDSTNANMMALASAYTKTTSAWAVGTGNGCLDTGSIANSTWYHIYLIERTDTLVVDVLCSTSASSPTMPTNYTVKRRIGSMKTNGSAQWTAFTQVGGYFHWLVAVKEFDGTPSSSGLLTLTVPTGVKVIARVRGLYSNTSAGTTAALYSPEESALTLNTPRGNFNLINPVAGQNISFDLQIMTDTSAHIRYAFNSSSDAAIDTYGWIDPLGK